MLTGRVVVGISLSVLVMTVGSFCRCRSPA